MSQSIFNLWTRVARLDRTCRVSLEAFWPMAGPGAGARWRVAIVHHHDTTYLPIVVEDGSAVEAILRAVQLAEGRGWHLVGGSPPLSRKAGTDGVAG